MRKATLAIDEVAVAEASRVLSTKGLTETVNVSKREVAAMAARKRFVERLRRMDGMDLDHADVMSRASR